MVQQVAPQQVPVKVYRTADRIMVAAPLPGLEPEDIHVDVTTNGHVVLRGEARGTLKGMQQVLADEWNAGPYHREVSLSIAVDGEHANVTYGNGVLVVALPVLPSGQPTRSAQLTPTALSPTRGELAGNAGRPPHPQTNAEHEAAQHGSAPPAPGQS